MKRVTVAEIYRSIMGEAPCPGRPCVVLRLAGCNLRCGYCDTPHALETQALHYRVLPLHRVADEVCTLGPLLVLMTGGEPMRQEGTPDLIELLLSGGFEVILETNGVYDLATLPDKVVRVVDVKCPGSGECGTFLVSNLEVLGPRDWLKFVILDREDYQWSLAFLRECGLLEEGNRWVGSGEPGILFSPVHGKLKPGVLAKWILDDDLEIRLNLQVHKYIGMP